MGPLLSPARPEYQIMGIANPFLGPIIAETMKTLGRRRAMVVHGAGTDEIAVHGDTLVWELKDGEITHYTLTPEDLGIGRHSLEDLRGGDGEENARLMRATFSGEGPAAHLDAVAANAGAMFYLYGDDTLADGVEHAKQLLRDGTVNEWLRTHEESDYSV